MDGGCDQQRPEGWEKEKRKVALYDRAQDAGIGGRSDVSKDDPVKALRDAR